MSLIIMVVIIVCGQIDTVIIKDGTGKTTYTHKVTAHATAKRIIDILNKKPIVIIYEENRGTCA